MKDIVTASTIIRNMLSKIAQLCQILPWKIDFVKNCSFSTWKSHFRRTLHCNRWEYRFLAVNRITMNSVTKIRFWQKLSTLKTRIRLRNKNTIFNKTRQIMSNSAMKTWFWLKCCKFVIFRHENCYGELDIENDQRDDI